MSGHSKWANIKRKKGANDAVRSSIFSKMVRLISSAVVEGGGIPDPEKNFKLRLAVERARSVNMPKDTIQRAIDKALGGDMHAMKECTYEAFGSGNIGLMITAVTDNPNRTLSSIKLVLDRNGGKLASPHAVSYLFQKCGVVELGKEQVTEEQAFGISDTLSGVDFEETQEAYIIYIPFENLGKVPEVLVGKEAMALDMYYLPVSPIEVSHDMLTKVEQLVEKLEDLEDVQAVYHNGV